MKAITNLTGVSLTLAVWLVHDEYDYVNEPNYISATTLMKPLRHIILPRRLAKVDSEAPDVVDFAARAMGTALHDSIEKAWVQGHKKALAKLGYPESVIAKVLINPTAEELAAVEDAIPIYIEQRAFRKIAGWTVGGKFDMVADGMVQDNKSTSAYTWVYGGRDDEHALQGSIYQWLNPDKIIEPFIRINYIFTDWQKAQVAQNPKYPKQRVEFKDIPLLGMQPTENWIRQKLALIEKHMDTPEAQLPLCTDEELWLPDPTFKYYADPTKTAGRSTRNLDTYAEAQKYMAEKGGKGIVITSIGTPKRCEYCEAFDGCTQKDKYFS
jgi:hypothetical protein